MCDYVITLSLLSALLTKSGMMWRGQLWGKQIVSHWGISLLHSSYQSKVSLSLD